MLMFAICDDDEIFRNKELDTICKIMDMDYQHIPYEIKQFSDGKDLLEGYVENKLDVIFLDIELGEENGFEIAFKLAKIHKETNIVFVTTYENLVFESFVFRPLGFIRKRAFEIELKQIMFRLVRTFVENKQMITFGEGKLKYDFLIDEIRMIQSFRHNIIITTENSNIQIRDQLKKYVNILLENDFIITGRGCIVNLRYISHIDRNTLYLYNNKVVEISRSHQNEVKSTFIKYQLKYAKGSNYNNGIDILSISDI